MIFEDAIFLEDRLTKGVFQNMTICSENLKIAIGYAINVATSFIGYEYCPRIEEALTTNFNLIAEAYNLSSSEKFNGNKFVLNLFHINKQYDFDSKTFSKELYSACAGAIDEYENVLKKLHNRTIEFNVARFQNQLNLGSLEGIPNEVRLKAFLTYNGVIYKQNKESAINLFRKCAYSFDPSSLLVLSRINEVDKDKYMSLKNKIDEGQDSDEKDLFFQKVIKNYKHTYKNSKIDHDAVEKLIKVESRSHTKVGFVYE